MINLCRAVLRLDATIALWRTARDAESTLPVLSRFCLSTPDFRVVIALAAVQSEPT
jgi:hypothetical protein